MSEEKHGPDTGITGPGGSVPELLAGVTQRLGEVERALGEVIVGQKEVVSQVITALLAGGHVLLEGVPGLGKTALVRAVAGVTGLSFRRIQFTPDLMPADVTGTEVYGGKDAVESFKFVPGPVFANIVLADEINRATPKTQSALLEAMQERTVTAGGQTRPLPVPFFVLATQNPLEMEGTYPLPEAQLDRFLFKINVAYPSAEELKAIGELTTGAVQPEIRAVIKEGELLQWQALVRKIVIVDDVTEYAVRLVMATSPESQQAPEMVRRYVRYGSGPRGLQSLLLGARAQALRAGRPAAGYDDVRSVARPALRHRLLLNFEAAAAGVTAGDVVEEILSTVPEA